MSEIKTDNTIAAFHIRKFSKGQIVKLDTKKLYNWNIPRRLRRWQIQKGDIVRVEAENSQALVLVMDVFRENLEETGKWYKRVIGVVDRPPGVRNWKKKKRKKRIEVQNKE